MSVVVRHQVRPGHGLHGLAELVEGIGTDEFGARLVGLLNRLCGADHCAVFQLGDDSISTLAFSSFDPAQMVTPMVERYVREGFWRKDPAISIARDQAAGFSSSLIHIDLDDIGYHNLRPQIYPQVRDRVVVCGRRDNLDFGLSVVRSNPKSGFGDGAMDQLAGLSDTLISTLAKHVSAMRRPNVATALTDLPSIINCFVACSDLPRREMEVCARILYGMSSLGIALDLGVGEESVKTYRKRAYQRLGIGCERELLHWYLSQWSAWCGHHCTLRPATVH